MRYLVMSSNGAVSLGEFHTLEEAVEGVPGACKPWLDSPKSSWNGRDWVIVTTADRDPAKALRHGTAAKYRVLKKDGDYLDFVAAGEVKAQEWCVQRRHIQQGSLERQEPDGAWAPRWMPGDRAD